MHGTSFLIRRRRRWFGSGGASVLLAAVCAGSLGMVGCSGKVILEPSAKGGGAGHGGKSESEVTGASGKGGSGVVEPGIGGTTGDDTAGAFASGEAGEAGSSVRGTAFGGTAGTAGEGTVGIAGDAAGGAAHGGTAGTAGESTVGGGGFAGEVNGVGGAGGAGGAPCTSVSGTAPDWQTFQGNPAHNGYVPATFNPNCFARVWEWKREPGGVLGFINSVATEAGKVFVTDDVYHYEANLYALNEQDGSLAWRWQFGNVPALNPPAVLNGMVYAATTGHDATILRGFRASDGGLVFNSPFDAQWPNLLAATVSGGRVFTNGGYYGGGVYAFDATNGSRFWVHTAGDDDMSTPAIDNQYAYYYSGIGLEVYGVSDGESVASIRDPYGPVQGYSYHGAPMLGSTDHIIAFSGGAFSGRGSSSVEQYDSRPLVNFSLQNVTTRWRSQSSYLTQPAVAKGVVYAGRSGPVLDALNEATGEVLWSWPGTNLDNEFHRNIIVTDNLLFVSTDRAVYAVDLESRQPVWSYPVPGMLAISARKMLYIVEGAREPTGRLIAIKLN